MHGTRLGSYQLAEELGSGGMGKVYRAEVVGPAPGLAIGDSVALKIVHAHLLERTGFFKRFLREAQIGQRIRHPNVVRCYDCDALLVEERQAHFLVMEYVEGQTLRDLLRELERVPEDLCRHIGLEVARALEAMHGAGVLHRDLKPENVVIAPDHVVKVMDLGVARLQEEAIRLSRVGDFVGSLEYAAPEQFRSKDGEPDCRADLHALGVVLYELATGVQPYRDEDPASVIRNVLEVMPRKAGERNPQLSPFFEEVVQTLLAKEREDRLRDAASLVAVLEEGEKGAWWKDRAHQLRIETRRPLRRVRIPRETALFGREEELAHLQQLFDRTMRGDGQVLLVEGEAGIGKTRLIDEFVGQVRESGDEVNFLFGAYPPGGAATAAGAFSTAYREHLGEATLEERLGGYLGQTPVLIPAFAALLRGDAMPSGAEPLTKDSLQTVFLQTTLALAEERPTIVLIDDLHFAPEEGRALFASLALGVPGHRVFLLGTMRRGVPDDWKADVERQEHANRRVLGRLGPKDLARLLEDAFRSKRLAEELAYQIGVKSDGNPFFALEIIRGLREGQFIAQEADGTWVTTKVIQDIQVPSSVSDLVNVRVADLSEEERDLLDVAACCGFEFDPALIADVLGLPLLPTLKRFGQIERRHRLVRAAGRRYAFDHHQVQEALYGSLFEQIAEEYHTSILDALERRAKAEGVEPCDLDGAACVELCDHALAGGQNERALKYLEAALGHLERGYLYDRAVALVDRALDRPGLLEGGARAEALVRKSQRLGILGRRAEQRIAVDEAVLLADLHGDASLRRMAHQARGVLGLETSRYDEAEDDLSRALWIAKEAEDERGEAYALANLGLVLSEVGRPADAEEHFRRCLAMTEELGDRRAEGRICTYLAMTCRDRGHYAEAREHQKRSLSISQEIHDRRNEASSEANLAYLCQYEGAFTEAQEGLERSIALFATIGDRRRVLGGRVSLGELFRVLGRYQEAAECLEAARAGKVEFGDRVGEGSALVYQGPLFVGMGLFDAAREALSQGGALLREIGSRRLESYAIHGMGLLLDEEDDVHAARATFEEALALRRELRYPRGIAMTSIALGRLLLRRGDEVGAEDHLEEARTIGEALDLPGTLVLSRCLVARLNATSVDEACALLASHEDRMDLLARMEAHHALWEVTGRVEHLGEAGRLLDALVANTPPEHRASLVEKVRLPRAIRAAGTR